MSGPILVFDSGIGGLSVLRPIHEALPGVGIVYVADDAAFPYGNWEDEALGAHIVTLMGRLIAEFEPALVVVACNTASTLVLPPLRAAYPPPFVGTVPAIKPAAETTKSGLVSVLATPGTMRRDYTRDLIKRFASSCHLRLVGSTDLARLAEAELRGERIADADILAEIEPAFVELDGKRTDTIVLACTHYPFLRSRFEAVAPWKVAWIDPAPAIARRVVAVLRENGLEPEKGGGEAFLTSGKAWVPALLPLLHERGLNPSRFRGFEIDRSARHGV
jgi:glutamate racemase